MTSTLPVWLWWCLTLVSISIRLVEVAYIYFIFVLFCRSNILQLFSRVPCPDEPSGKVSPYLVLSLLPCQLPLSVSTFSHRFPVYSSLFPSSALKIVQLKFLLEWLVMMVFPIMNQSTLFPKPEQQLYKLTNEVSHSLAPVISKVELSCYKVKSNLFIVTFKIHERTQQKIIQSSKSAEPVQCAAST